MQLLDYGADVHNPGQIIRQTPLRVAVCDLNMDCELVELLVSRGASPFLEDPDGQFCNQNMPAYVQCDSWILRLEVACCVELVSWGLSRAQH